MKISDENVKISQLIKAVTSIIDAKVARVNRSMKNGGTSEYG